MSAHHTPGPWQLHEHFVKGQWGNSDRWVCEITCPNNNLIVAEIPEYRSYPEDTPAVEANARLIASAPELYERLKEARDAIASLPEYALGGESIYSSHTGEIVGDYPIRDELLHHIDAALSKAAGEGV